MSWLSDIANLTAKYLLARLWNILLRKDGGLANASVTILETDELWLFQVNVWNNLDYMNKWNRESLNIAVFLFYR